MTSDEGVVGAERPHKQNEGRSVEIERGGVRRPRIRAAATVVAIVFAVAAFTVALPGAWARRTLTNTETYISVVGPLAANPAVRDALAREITAAVFESVDVEAELSAVLTDRAPELAFLAGPISQSVQQFVQDKVLKIVESEQFRIFWEQANTLVQAQLVAVLRGETSLVQVQNGEVVLNYLPIVNEALQQVSSTLGTLLDKQITLPEITPNMVPADAITRLNAALGVTLPATFGTVVVYKSDVLSAVQDTVKLARQGFVILLAIVLIGVAVALAVSPHRRRTLLQLAVSIAVVTVIERRIGIASMDTVAALVPAESQAAVRAVADALISWFLDFTVWFLWVALITITIALLSGPYPWAVWFRGAVSDVVHHTLHPDEVARAGAPSARIAAHRALIMAVIAGLAGLILWTSSLSTPRWLVVVLVMVLLELCVWRVARGPAAERVATS